MVGKIHEATEEGDVHSVRELLRSEPRLVDSFLGDDQPLHLAAWQGHEDIVALLLECGANVNAQGDGGKTPLHYAIAKSHHNVARLLLAWGALPNIQDNRKLTPAYLAASVGDKEGMEVLSQAHSGNDLPTLLYTHGQERVLEVLKDKASLSGSDASFLMRDAIRTRSIQLIKELVRSGCDVNALPPGGGIAPLFQAVNLSDAQIVEVLLKAGADVKATDHVGRSLRKFCDDRNSSVGIRELLRQHGAEV